MRELDRVVARLHGWSAGFSRNPPKGGTPAEPQISFPDGLSISLSRARLLLTSAGTATVAPPPPLARRQGPTGELRLKWAFDTTARRPGRGDPACRPADSHRRPVGHALRGRSSDRQARWERAEALPPCRMPFDANNPGYALAWQQAAGPGLIVDDAGRFYAAGPAKVSCRSVEDGRLLWEATVAAERTAPGRAARRGDDRSFATHVPLRGESADVRRRQRHADED